jgi:hypothetical protein
MHIGPQLHPGSFFGTFYQSLGGSPEQPSGYAEDDRKNCNDRLSVLVNEFSRTAEPSFEEYQEIGSTFIKGIAGFVVILLVAAGLKRW